MAYCEPGSGALFLFALSTCPHSRAARRILEELKTPFTSLEVDLPAEPEQRLALAELARHNPAQTFPTLLAGTKVAAGPLPEDFRRLALRASGRRWTPPSPDLDGGSGRRPFPGSGGQAADDQGGAAFFLCGPGYGLNPDRTWTREVLAGLRVNAVRYGYGSCPSRLATGRQDQDQAIICPCAFRTEDMAKYGRCYGHLYFSPRVSPGRVPAVPDRWLR